MLAETRRALILERALQEGRVVTKDVAAEFGVSEMTARRDIGWLCDTRRLARVHGGAVVIAATTASPLASRTTGLVVPTSDYYYTQVIRGAENVAATLGMRLILGVSHYDLTAERERVAQLVELGVQGLLLTTSQGDVSGRETGEWLDTIPVPVVLMERAFAYPDTTVEFDYVRTDHAYGASLAVRHLASRGFASIGLALIEESPTSYWLDIGFRRTMAHLGLPDDGPRFSSEGGTRPIDESLSSFLDDCVAAGTRAVFVHADTNACRLAELALQRGLRIPEDLAVVAYDDEVAAFAVVPLTAVAPPKREMGVLGMRLLGERMNGRGNDGQAVRHTSLLPSLVERASTAR